MALKERFHSLTSVGWAAAPTIIPFLRDILPAINTIPSFITSNVIIFTSYLNIYSKVMRSTTIKMFRLYTVQYMHVTVKGIQYDFFTFFFINNILISACLSSFFFSAKPILAPPPSRCYFWCPYLGSLNTEVIDNHALLTKLCKKDI